MVVDPNARFNTVEVANIIRVSRLNFYEWTARDYIRPVETSKYRGNASVFDMAGLMAAAIFSRLKGAVRRPVAGKISNWYQEHCHRIECEHLFCVVTGDDVHISILYEGAYLSLSKMDFMITIPIGSLRQEIETRIKEIACHGNNTEGHG